MGRIRDKQELFCNEYIIDLNATQAAIRAGYSEKTAQEQSSRLLSNVIIQDRISELKLGRIERVKIDADWVLVSAKKVFDRCMQEEEIKSDDGAVIGQYKFEHSGANKALEIIGKHVKVRAFEKEEESENVGQPLSISFNIADAVKDVKVTKGE